MENEETKVQPGNLLENEETKAQPNNPLHGVTLKTIVETLHKVYGWEELYEMVRINCFLKNPSIKSSLTFLRKTSWAREKVEELYIDFVKYGK